MEAVYFNALLFFLFLFWLSGGGWETEVGVDTHTLGVTPVNSFSRQGENSAMSREMTQPQHGLQPQARR